MVCNLYYLYERRDGPKHSRKEKNKKDGSLNDGYQNSTMKVLSLHSVKIVLSSLIPADFKPLSVLQLQLREGRSNWPIK